MIWLLAASPLHHCLQVFSRDAFDALDPFAYLERLLHDYFIIPLESTGSLFQKTFVGLLYHHSQSLPHHRLFNLRNCPLVGVNDPHCP